ncbi:MAG: DNA repair protein RecO [Anaerolineales bacterium]|nr:DNA repair protein RecO [Anaerolineales bacterium]
MSDINPPAPQSTRRQRLFRLEAVVLRHTDWGEADRLIWLFTREMGKLRAVAKGVRKPRSRKAGHLEPFTRVNLLLARGRDLPLITQADTVDAYLPLRDSLLRTTYASYIVELLDRFTFEEASLTSAKENRALYRLLTDTLERLSQAENPASSSPAQTVGRGSPELAVRYYEMRLLDFVGFRPQLFTCTVCGAEILPQDQYFSPRQGGVLCPTCGSPSAALNRPADHDDLVESEPHPASAARPISMKALKYLRHFQRSSYAEAARAVLTPILNRELEGIMQGYITYVLERGLNTPSFIRRVRQNLRDTPSETGDAQEPPPES